MTLEILQAHELWHVFLTRGPNTVRLHSFKTLDSAERYVARITPVLDQRAVLVP